MASLPVCCESSINVEQASAQINENVLQRLRSALSLFRVDYDVIERLRPTHILTQMHCEVCAVSESDVRDFVRDRLDGRPEVISLSPSRLDELWASIRDVAVQLGVSEQGAKQVERLQERLDRTRRFTTDKDRPRVACIEWLEPLMTAGNWIPELVETAGGRDLFGTAGEHSPWLAWQDLHDAQPDVIIVFPCGFTLQRTQAEFDVLGDRIEWQPLREIPTFLADGHQFFNRPGPRLVESAEILAEILHPDVVEPVHEGTGWIRWNSAG